MSKIKRYGFQLNDPGKDPDEKFVRHGVGVPAKFTETPGRILLKKIFRVLGLTCFICILMFIPILIFHRVGWINEYVFIVLRFAVFGVIFISHLGFFFEMAIDGGGENWFARSAALPWIFFFGSFLIALGWYLIKLIFGLEGG